MGLLISGSSWFEYCLVLPAFLCLQITAELQVELRVSCRVLPAHRCVEWGVPITVPTQGTGTVGRGNVLCAPSQESFILSASAPGKI